MTHILAVGLDTDLLLTRGLVLQRTGADVHTCLLETALELLETDFFDIVVLCHTLPPEASIRVCRIVELFWPETRVILIGETASSTCMLPARLYGTTTMLRPTPARLLDLSLHLLQGAPMEPRTLCAVIPYTMV